MKTMAILLPVALVGLPVLGAPASANPACEAARSALEHELRESGGEATLDVALALRAAVSACPPAPSSSSLPDPLDLFGDEPGNEHVKYEVERQPWDPKCSRLSPARAELAPLDAAWGLLDQPSKTEWGPADAAYDPSGLLSTYAARGQTYALVANGAPPRQEGTGTIFVHGVPIEASVAWANAGCGWNDPSLCWGYGHAMILVKDFLVLSAKGAFNHCAP